MVGNCIELEPSMNSVQIEDKSYEMPPREGFTIAHFLTVADIDRSARFYEKVFGGRILSRGDSKGAPGYIQIANSGRVRARRQLTELASLLAIFVADDHARMTQPAH